MNIPISDLHRMFVSYLTKKSFSEEDAHTIADVFTRAELMGKKTHGISKFLLLEKAIAAREDKPEIVKDKFNYALIDAHKELGYLSANFACDVLIKKAQEFDNATVAVVNSFYFAMASIYAEKVARAGFVALIFNNGGPATVAPFGGIDPLFGTNPIAIGVPTDSEPIVLDMATSEQPWGEVGLAKVEERKLADHIFINQRGDFTTDPEEVEALIPFGNNAKGYGLNFMTEILTGGFVGAKMGLESQNAYDLGFLFMALSPTMFGTEDQFKQSVARLTQEVKTSRKMQNVSEIFLPGERSHAKYIGTLQQGTVEIADSAWQKLNAFVEGANIMEQQRIKE